MKTKLIVLAMLFFPFKIYGQTIHSSEKKNQEEVTFIVGMHCLGCKERIEKAISMERGVKDINIDFEKKEVTIIYKPNKTGIEVLKKAIEDLGYNVSVKKTNS